MNCANVFFSLQKTTKQEQKTDCAHKDFTRTMHLSTAVISLQQDMRRLSRQINS
jgi:hypothetical protein